MSSMRIGAVRAVARRVPGAPRDGARVFVLSTAKRPTGAARLMTGSRSGNTGGTRVRASKDDETAVKDVEKRRRAHPLDDETAPSTASTPADRDVADDEPVNLVEEFKRGMDFGNSMKERFTTARIDDRGLPIADALVCVTASMFVATMVLALGIPGRRGWSRRRGCPGGGRCRSWCRRFRTEPSWRRAGSRARSLRGVRVRGVRRVRGGGREPDGQRRLFRDRHPHPDHAVFAHRAVCGEGDAAAAAPGTATRRTSS